MNATATPDQTTAQTTTETVAEATPAAEGKVVLTPAVRWDGPALDPDDDHGRLLRNFAVLGAAIASKGFSELLIEYRGYGDSGETDEVSLTSLNADGKPQSSSPKDMPSCVIAYRSRVHNPQTQQYESVVEAREFSFSEAASHVVDDVIEVNNHVGFENNDGGRGDLTVYADGRAEYNHEDYYTESIHDGNEYESLGALTEETSAATPSVRQAEALPTAWPSTY